MDENVNILSLGKLTVITLISFAAKCFEHDPHEMQSNLIGVTQPNLPDLDLLNK
jgi:hypothetical protein